MRRNSERILLLWLVGGIFHETLDTVWNTRRHSAVAPLCEVRWGFVQSWESCFNSASSPQNGHFRVTNKMKRIHTDRCCKLCSNLHPSEFLRNVPTTWFVSAKILTWNQQTVQGCLEINTVNCYIFSPTFRLLPAKDVSSLRLVLSHLQLYFLYIIIWEGGKLPENCHTSIR